MMRILSTLLLLAYWPTIFLSTHIPKLPQAVGRVPDKAAHFVAYAGLAVLVSFFIAVRREFTVRAALGVLALMIAYGAIDELTQTFIPGRSCELNDWIADALGAAIGVVSFGVAWRVLPFRRWTQPTLAALPPSRRAAPQLEPAESN